MTKKLFFTALVVYGLFFPVFLAGIICHYIRLSWAIGKLAGNFMTDGFGRIK